MFKFLDKKWSEFPLSRLKNKLFDSSTIHNNSLDQIYNIYDLHRYINAFTKCELKKNSKNTVIFDGKINSNIMIIGEAPGEEEDNQGIPFVGKSGKILRQMLEDTGITEYYITNAVFWRPPNNRKPTDVEISICKPMVLKQIELVNPSYILLLGSTALQLLFDYKYTISKQRGKVLYWNNRLVFSSFHPSYILRMAKYKYLLQNDLTSFKSFINIKN